MKRPFALLLLPLLAGISACSPPSAEDLVRQVMQQRTRYTVTLGSWVVSENAVPPYLQLDVTVVNNNQDVTLRTVTVMVEQLDADGNVLAEQRVSIDTSAFTPGFGQSKGVQVSPAAPGVDGLRLYIESAPERAVWDEFPEFAAVRPRI